MSSSSSASKNKEDAAELSSTKKEVSATERAAKKKSDDWKRRRGKDYDFFVPPLGTVKEEKKKQRRERKFEEDPSMTKALVNLYFMITFLGVSVFSSSFLGILDDHNNGRKEISLARVVGALAGMFITNTSSKRVGQTRARKVAMKGLCPGCDEEVYTFFDNEEKGEGRGSIVEHECHCCGAQLVFESKRESNREGRIVLIANGRLNANE